MERGCSHSFVPTQLVCVPCELVNSGRPTRTDTTVAQLTFAAGPCKLDSGAGVPSRGQRMLLTQRTALHAMVPQGKSLAGDGASHPSRHPRDECRSFDIAVVARRGLLKLLRTSRRHSFAGNYIGRASFATRSLPREPPGQAMAVSRGSCRGRALRRPLMLHPVSPMAPHVHQYPRGPPAYEATLPAPINRLP